MSAPLGARIKLAAKVLLGRTVAGRTLAVRPDDVFIVSYPKSGNTWFRFLVANLLSGDEPVTFLNIERIVPDIYLVGEAELMTLPSPRYVKSHESFDPNYRTVIYLVRDPRDVAVSYYHHHIRTRKMSDDYPLVDFVERFVLGELDTYGTWRENVGSWLGARTGSPGFLLLRYEDLLADTRAELQRVARFLSFESTHDRIEQAVMRSSVQAMRELEKEQATLWKPTRGGRQDKSFVRSASAGGWKKELSPRSAEMIEAAWADQMRMLGYHHVGR